MSLFPASWVIPCSPQTPARQSCRRRPRRVPAPSDLGCRESEACQKSVADLRRPPNLRAAQEETVTASCCPPPGPSRGPGCQRHWPRRGWIPHPTPSALSIGLSPAPRSSCEARVGFVPVPGTHLSAQALRSESRKMMPRGCWGLGSTPCFPWERESESNMVRQWNRMPRGAVRD